MFRSVSAYFVDKMIKYIKCINIIVKHSICPFPTFYFSDDRHQGIAQERSRSVNTLMIQNNCMGYSATIDYRHEWLVNIGVQVR